MNIPNSLALIRLLIAPIVFFLLVNRDAQIFNGIDKSWIDLLAFTLFLIASATDFFDGYIARKFNQITTLGEILDPLADKMLTLAGFLGLMLLQRASPWAIFLILLREFFITGLRVLIASKGLDVSASFIGKIKTIVQMVTIGLLILNWQQIGTPILWIAVLLTIYSGYEYTKEFAKTYNS